jgi:hypothetical protein
MVSDRTLQVIAVWAHEGARPLDMVEINNAVITLYVQNVASLKARYSDGASMASPEPLPMNLLDVQKFFSSRITIATVLRACDCYDYQACETSDYAESEAARIVARARYRAGRKVEGYEAAPWGTL